jgi:hypothetical protein
MSEEQDMSEEENVSFDETVNKAAMEAMGAAAYRFLEKNAGVNDNTYIGLVGNFSDILYSEYPVVNGSTNYKFPFDNSLRDRMNEDVDRNAVVVARLLWDADEHHLVKPLIRTITMGCVLTFLETNKDKALEVFKSIANGNKELFLADIGKE